LNNKLLSKHLQNLAKKKLKTQQKNFLKFLLKKSKNKKEYFEKKYKNGGYEDLRVLFVNYFSVTR